MNHFESIYPTDFVQGVLNRLHSDPEIKTYLDSSLPIPAPFIGPGPIRLVILGQDPTVKNAQARRSITTVLNLNRNGSLRAYLQKVCTHLGLDLDREVYATNLYKNFFIQEPTQITDINIFQRCLPYWLPVLQAELAQFPGVPVLTLGEPLLETLVCGGASGKVRDYWGYAPGWKRGESQPFHALPAERNLLGRPVFPFPHQPSWQRKKFYSDRMPAYAAFCRDSSPPA